MVISSWIRASSIFFHMCTTSLFNHSVVTQNFYFFYLLFLFFNYNINLEFLCQNEDHPLSFRAKICIFHLEQKSKFWIQVFTIYIIVILHVTKLYLVRRTGCCGKSNFQQSFLTKLLRTRTLEKAIQLSYDIWFWIWGQIFTRFASHPEQPYTFQLNFNFLLVSVNHMSKTFC